MKHWIGRQVVIYLERNSYFQIKGILRKWDSSGFCIVKGLNEKKIYFQEISKIELANAIDPYQKELERSLLHSVGYMLTSDIQFDNAIYFKSFIMVWNKDQLMTYGTKITAHDKEYVTLIDGTALKKDQFQFVVRSLRSQP